MPKTLVALLLIGCVELSNQKSGTTTEKPNVVAPGCGSACDNLRRLGCKEGRPEGETCEEVCSDAEKSGIVDLDTDCLTAITSCDQVDGC